MEEIRVYVFPGILTLGALLMLVMETRTLQGSPLRDAARWSRFIRRATGALVIAGIAFMVHFSPGLPPQGTPPDVVLRQYNYWMCVIVLVLVAVFLAFWDVVASIRAIKQQVDSAHNEDLRILQEQIRARR